LKLFIGEAPLEAGSVPITYHCSFNSTYLYYAFLVHPLIYLPHVTSEVINLYCTETTKVSVFTANQEELNLNPHPTV